jgi:hypothetical protein
MQVCKVILETVIFLLGPTRILLAVSGSEYTSKDH